MQKKHSPFWPPVKWLVRVFYGKMTVLGAENLPDEPCIIVGNHAQMHGPIVCELHLPIERYTWCAGQMMHLKDVPAYAFQDFWSYKPKAVHWLYRLLSYLIAPLSVFIFKNANTIGVYHDARIVSTFKKTISTLVQGQSVVIFPECDTPRNNIVYEFQDKFIDLAKLYYKRTGKELSFVPLYIAPSLKSAYLGTPTRFCAEEPMEEERTRICEYLMNTITDTARDLPLHRVVPYRNVSKKEYPLNEVSTNENSGC